MVIVLYYFEVPRTSLKMAFAPGILDILVDNFRTREDGIIDKIMSDSWSEYSYLQNTSLLSIMCLKNSNFDLKNRALLIRNGGSSMVE